MMVLIPHGMVSFPLVPTSEYIFVPASIGSVVGRWMSLRANVPIVYKTEDTTPSPRLKGAYLDFKDALPEHYRSRLVSPSVG